MVMNSKENRTGFYAWYDSLTPEEKAEFNKPDPKKLATDRIIYKALNQCKSKTDVFIEKLLDNYNSAQIESIFSDEKDR